MDRATWLPTTNGWMALLLSLDAGSGACLARIDCQLAHVPGDFSQGKLELMFIDSKDEEFVERNVCPFSLLFNEFSLVVFAAFKTRFSKFGIG